MAQGVQARVLDLSRRESGSLERGRWVGLLGKLGWEWEIEKMKISFDSLTDFPEGISFALSPFYRISP